MDEKLVIFIYPTVVFVDKDSTFNLILLSNLTLPMCIRVDYVQPW